MGAIKNLIEIEGGKYGNIKYIRRNENNKILNDRFKEKIQV